ncbi:hypothetical protein SAMN04489727_6223 [Amycolatopsis tolypomycina]|uniref:Uncharacterized protein n=1 Tax=Amycolatopsis tolypomycina TaxID=208445 RepID=A0A1H4XK06_9PSEU|nr:hypothetical protein [Amycolatopsis tolypomycina]SED05946.1 hypothetical protein SAMN04489727_6223 [Amycolatopsis tolypomycina]
MLADPAVRDGGGLRFGAAAGRPRVADDLVLPDRVVVERLDVAVGRFEPGLAVGFGGGAEERGAGLGCGAGAVEGIAGFDGFGAGYPTG